MTDPIRITPEDLRDPRIDEQLARQQSFGFALHGGEEKPTPIYLKPWLALMLSGAVAAVLVWILIEPFMDDGVRFRGRVTHLGLDLPGGQNRLIAGVLTIDGMRLLVSSEAMILDETDREIPLGDIHEGDSLEVLAQVQTLEDGSEIAGSAYLRKVPPIGGDEPPVDFKRLRTRETIISFLLFPVMAGMMGLFLGATDGVLSRAWTRAAVTGSVSLATGIAGGLFATIVGGLLYATGQGIVWGLQGDESPRLSGMTLLAQIMVRGLAWTVVGLCVGLGQGVALRSKKLILNGLIGGTLGGLLGGILFDPINLALENVYRTGGAEISRLFGYVTVGAAIGLMIGLVELVAREAWVRLLTGPIGGKEFVLYRNPTWIGSSPKCEIYLFKDAQVAPRHANIHRVGEHYEIEDQGTAAGTVVSGQRIQRKRLRDRDRIQVGQSAMEFRLRDE